jgi:hypothetical protein
LRGRATGRAFAKGESINMNMLIAQETGKFTPVNGIFHDILTFLYFLPHQIGSALLKLLQSVFPRVAFPDSLIDPVGFLVILTLFMALISISKRIAWIIVSIGWILLAIRILMLFFKIG